MIRLKNRSVAVAGGIAALALVLTACGSGSDSGAGSSPTRDANEVQAVGDGTSLNSYGGTQLAVGDPTKGGELKLGIATPIETLSPYVPLPTGAFAAVNAIYGQLIDIQPDGSYTPDLAESLDSADGQTWTLKLRSGVTFSDGTPYNADAFVTHVQTYQSDSTTARDAASVRAITTITKVDDLTVTMELAAPNYDFPQLFQQGLSWVPSPTAVAAGGDQWGLKPVGAGPFKVDSFTPSGDLVLVRNDTYFDPELPYLDKLTLVTATDSAARLAALKAGDIDLAPTADPTDFENARSAGLTVLEQPVYTYYEIMMNLSKPPFDDIDFRNAVKAAIDTQSLSQAVFGGLAKPMKGYFVENHPNYADTGYTGYDLDTAKALVEKLKAAGKPTSFELVTTSPPEFQRQASVLQQMLADAGIEMTITVADQPTMITSANNGDYEAQHRFIGFTLQAASDLGTRFGGKSPGNITKVADDKLDGIIAQLKATPAAERQDLFTQAQQELTDTTPIVPLLQQVGGWIAGAKVGGFPGFEAQTINEFVNLQKIWAK